jgi:O-antigen/teichoic acid export membrane protein
VDVTLPSAVPEPKRRPRRSFSLRANFAITMASRGSLMALSLFISPFIVSRIGLSDFGLWALISAISQYATLMDFGVGGLALTRFVGQLGAMGEHDELARKGAAALWMSIGFGLVIIGLSVGGCALLPLFLHHRLAAGWRWAVIGVGINLACVSMASTFQAFPAGFSRFDLQNIPVLVSQLVYAGVVVGTLLAGLGLKGLGIATAASGVALVITARLVLRLVWTQSWGFWHAGLKDIRTLLGYGVNLQAAAMVVVINLQSDKPVILAVGGSLRFIGLYELASKAAFSLRSIPVVALGPLIVRAAAVTAGRSKDAIGVFYERALRVNIAYAVAPLFALYGACYPLTLAWLGKGFHVTALIVLLLGAGYATNLLTGAGTAVANGCGRPQLDRNYSLFGLAINIVGTVVFGILFGPWGVIAATTLGLVVSSFWLLRMMDTWLDMKTLSTSWLVRNGLWSNLIGIACGALAVLATVVLPIHSRLGWLALGTGSIAVSTVVLATTSSQTRQWVAANAGRLRFARSEPLKTEVVGEVKE